MPADSTLAKWQAIAGKGDRAAVEKASSEVQQALTSADVLKGPDAAVYKELLSPRGPYSYMNPVKLSHLTVFFLGRPSRMLLTLARMAWK